MIRDYLQGLRITRGGDIIADGSTTVSEFEQQLNFVKAAKETLSSTLIDLKSILQVDLFDTEIESVAALEKSGYLRAAEAIRGVVIEKHLHYVCDVHNIKISKKNPGSSDLNELLKTASIITVPQWRFIQHLADIRNICNHAREESQQKKK